MVLRKLLQVALASVRGVDQMTFRGSFQPKTFYDSMQNLLRNRSRRNNHWGSIFSPLVKRCSKVAWGRGALSRGRCRRPWRTDSYICHTAVIYRTYLSKVDIPFFWFRSRESRVLYWKNSFILHHSVRMSLPQTLHHWIILMNKYKSTTPGTYHSLKNSDYVHYL